MLFVKDSSFLIAFNGNTFFLNKELSWGQHSISYIEPERNDPYFFHSLTYFRERERERGRLNLLKLVRMNTNNIRAHFTHQTIVVGKPG